MILGKKAEQAIYRFKNNEMIANLNKFQANFHS